MKNKISHQKYCDKCGVWLILFFVFSGMANSSLAMDKRLNKIQLKLEHKYADVSHVKAGQFSKMDLEKLVIFDVREDGEFAVSHIHRATQLDPNLQPEEFLSKYKDKIKGKTVVFYCSVGRRSSAMASRLQASLAEAGAAESFNLTGGLFNWRNENRPLMSDGQETDFIHPYNFYWGRLIHDKNAIRYK